MIELTSDSKMYPLVFLIDCCVPQGIAKPMVAILLCLAGAFRKINLPHPSADSTDSMCLFKRSCYALHLAVHQDMA